MDSRDLLDVVAITVVQQDDHDGTGVITEANLLVCQLSGYDRDELIGQPLDILIPERSRTAHRHYRLGYMAHPIARAMGPDREVVMLHKDGHEIRVMIGLSPVRGIPNAAVAVISQIPSSTPVSGVPYRGPDRRSVDRPDEGHPVG